MLKSRMRVWLGAEYSAVIFEHGGGVVFAPKGMDCYEWLDSVAELGPAASPDADDDEFE